VRSRVPHAISLAAAPGLAAARDAAFGGDARAGGRGWFAAFDEDDPAAWRYLLLLRFAVVNLVAAALLGGAWLNGWIVALLVGDAAALVAIIALVFLVGLAACLRRLVQTSVELNRVKSGIRPADSLVARYLTRVRERDGQSRAIAAGTLRLKLASRIAPVRHVANSLVFLGLIGTVIGFIIALSGVDPKLAGDVNAIAPMVSTLIDGMSVALHTTLVGALLNVWLMLNYRILEGGTVRLLTAVVELGEDHARD